MSSKLCDRLKTIAPEARYPHIVGVIEAISEAGWKPEIKLAEINAALAALNKLEKENQQ